MSNHKVFFTTVVFPGAIRETTVSTVIMHRSEKKASFIKGVRSYMSQPSYKVSDSKVRQLIT